MDTPTGVSTPRWRRSAPWLVSEPSLWARCKPKIVRSWPSPCKWSVPALHCRSDQLSRSILIRARLNHGLHISSDIWRPDAPTVSSPPIARCCPSPGLSVRATPRTDHVSACSRRRKAILCCRRAEPQARGWLASRNAKAAFGQRVVRTGTFSACRAKDRTVCWADS